MANILSLKRRMQTAQNVSKTTKALQMIAASKLKRAQDATLMSRPYVEKLTVLSQTLASKVEKEDLHPYMIENPGKKQLTIVISPDKGLCGSLVTNLIKEVILNENGDTEYVVLGNKLDSALKRLNKEIIASFPFGTTLPSFDVVYPMLQLIDDYFLNKKVPKVNIISAGFISVFTQKAETKDLLPIKLEGLTKSSHTLFEPSATELLPDILRHFLEMSIYHNVIETYASEQAARMIAMKNATDNANDVISELRLEYNKERQEKITNEILDIGGATFALSYEE